MQCLPHMPANPTCKSLAPLMTVGLMFLRPPELEQAQFCGCLPQYHALNYAQSSCSWPAWRPERMGGPVDVCIATPNIFWRTQEEECMAEAPAKMASNHLIPLTHAQQGRSLGESGNSA